MNSLEKRKEQRFLAFPCSEQLDLKVIRIYGWQVKVAKVTLTQLPQDHCPSHLLGHQACLASSFCIPPSTLEERLYSPRSAMEGESPHADTEPHRPPLFCDSYHLRISLIVASGPVLVLGGVVVHLMILI